MVLFDITGALMLLGQSKLLRASGILLLLFSWILDHVDGEVRRYQKKSSTYGILLDRFTHYVGHPLVHFCLGWSLGITDSFYRLLGALSAMAILIIFTADLQCQLLRADGQAIRPPTPARKDRSWLVRLPVKLFGAYRGIVMIGYGSNVLTLLLISIVFGFVREFYVFLSFSIYLNLLLTLGSMLRYTYRTRENGTPDGGGQHPTEDAG